MNKLSQFFTIFTFITINLLTLEMDTNENTKYCTSLNFKSFSINEHSNNKAKIITIIIYTTS